MEQWIVRIHHQDCALLHLLLSRRQPWLDVAMGWLTHLGGATASIAIAAALAAGLIPALGGAGGQALFALVASHLAVQLFKRMVTRERPRLPAGIGALVQAPDRFSFPSGHAAAGLSVALPIAVGVPGVIGAAVLALAGVVGISRCYLGVHYPGDVIAGWALAAGAVLVSEPALGFIVALLLV